MMETRLLARLLATARTVNALGAVTAVRDAGADHSQIVRAQVAARLADGSFRVLVDGKPVKLALPANVSPGDVIELRFVNRESSGRSEGASAEANGALSDTGRLIASLLRQASAAPQQQAKPILDLPPTTPADLPEPLARAVERSGMFYESHQARWVEGDYPLERLLQEPQAALSQRRLPAADIATAERAPLPAATPVKPPVSALADSGATEQAGSPGLDVANTRRMDDLQSDLVAREALPLVRNQLDALDSRHITWLGEIWPGQPMRWEIGEEDTGPRQADDDAGWNTRFSLALPMLGDVGADLAIGAGGVRLSLQAGTTETAAMMRSAAPELSQALAAAGCAIAHFTVTSDEPSA